MTQKERFQDMLTEIEKSYERGFDREEIEVRHVATVYSDVLSLDTKLKQMLEDNLKNALTGNEQVEEINNYIKSRQK